MGRMRWEAAGPLAAVIATTAAATTALTRHGVLLEADSTPYLWTSRFMRANPTGFWDLPLDSALSIRTRYPPLYPMVLAVTGWPLGDLTAARVVGIVLAVVTVGLLFRLIERNSSTTTALTVVAVLVVSRGFLLVNFGFLMSDGLFLALSVAAIVLAEHALRADPPLAVRPWLAAATAAASAATLTRVAGIAVVAALAILVLAAGEGPRRWRTAVGVVLAGIAPLLLWSLIVAGGPTDAGRRFQWTPSASALSSIARLPLRSTLPRQALDALGSTGTVVLGGAIVVGVAVWSAARIRSGLTRSASTDAPRRVEALLLVVGWLHLAAVTAARFLVDPLIGVEGRMTMLWWTCMVAAIGLAVGRPGLVAADAAETADRRTRAARRWVGASAGGLLVVSGAVFVRSLGDPGASWYHVDVDADRSALAARAARQPDDVVVYTNREDLLYLQEGRTTRELPLPNDAWGPDPAFDRRVRALRTEVRAGRAIVALFTGDPTWSAAPDDYARRTGSTIAAREPEGVLLVGATRRG